MRFPEITYQTKYLEDLNIDELHKVTWLLCSGRALISTPIITRQTRVAVRTELDTRGLDNMYESFCKTDPFEGVKARPIVVI